MRSPIRFLLACAVFFLFATSAEAGPNKAKVFLPASSGVSAAACVGGVASAVFEMDGSEHTYRQITLMYVPAVLGTSTVLDVKCSDGPTASSLAPKYKCDNGSPKSTCVEDIRSFPLLAAGVPTVWRTAQRFMQCTATCDGNGTLNLTATLMGD